MLLKRQAFANNVSMAVVKLHIHTVCMTVAIGMHKECCNALKNACIGVYEMLMYW